jgi:hypothetical protein
MKTLARRHFLAQVGGGMLVAALGASLADHLGLAHASAEEARKERLTFGELEPLVALMQETPPERLLPLLAERIKSGTQLRTLVAAGALANARAFGGQDYIGYHTFMALGPAYAMSRQMEASQQAIPVLKVLYRNAQRIQAAGLADSDRLDLVESADRSAEHVPGEALQRVARTGDMAQAERTFAGLVDRDAGEAFNHLQYLVEDEVDVHRVVLCWRAWESLDLTGKEHAHTLLRQSVRYCVDVENRMKDRGREPSPIRSLLPRLLDQYRLIGRSPGGRTADDAWVDQLADSIANGSGESAADTVAGALADGFRPEDIGEAISLAANSLLLRDPGRPAKWASPEKPEGSVHGDSPGVHASDAANAWRNIARVGDARTQAASLIVGAFHTAGQTERSTKEPLPTTEQRSAVTSIPPDQLAEELRAAVREKDQVRACAIATRCGELQLAPEPVFQVLLDYAVSQDGALHAEKYYRTVTEEFAATRPAYRWRHLAGLARVAASQYGHESAGYTLAKELI